MIHSLLKEYLLLEVSALSLKDVLKYVASEEDSSVVDRLRNLWGKKYRKYSNVIISLLTQNNQAGMLQKILDSLDRYDPYYDTSYLTKEMVKSSSNITITLKDINDYIQSIKDKDKVLSEDKMSLQDVLDVWRKAGSPKTFESNHFDIIHADEDVTIVKPKTPKGSVAWASCTANGVLERYGSEDIGNEYKSSWCTSIYKADKKSFNEFYTYYLGNMTSLYYVIKNKDYDLTDDYRRICVGIDDINNKIKYGSVTVNAKNNFLDKQEDIEQGYSEDVFHKILGKIYLDPKNAEEKQEDYPTNKNEVNILFKNRYKSFTAMSKLRLFLCKTKDENLISFTIDLLIDAYKKDAIENDLEFILDFLNNVFNESKLGKKIRFSNQILSLLNKLLEMKNFITSEILEKINTIVLSKNIDSFDSSLLSLLKSAVNSLNTKRQHDIMKSIFNKLELDGNPELIKLADLRPVSDLFNKENEDFNYLIDSAKVEDESVYEYIIKNNLYQKNIQELNHSLLTNPLLFKTNIGKQLLESLLNKDRKVYPYFVKIISAIAENESLPEYDNIYKLIAGLVTNEMFTDDFIETYGEEIRRLISEQELNQYLTLAYNIYKDKEDVFSVDIIDKIEGMFEEEEYKELSP